MKKFILSSINDNVTTYELLNILNKSVMNQRLNCKTFFIQIQIIYTN